MIKLGFMSAILAVQTFEEVISFAAPTGYPCVEVEDRSYEGFLLMRKKSLAQSREYLKQFPVL